jgi:hypothetical protein
MKTTGIDNEARGQVLEYAERIGGRVNILLADSKGLFNAFRFDNGQVTAFHSGHLSDAGIADSIKRFLLREEDPIPDHVRLFLSCKQLLSFEVLSGAGFLGVGGSAHGYQGLHNGTTVAVKVFSPNRAHLGRLEVSNIHRLCDAGLAPASVIRSANLHDGGYAFMAGRVGLPVELPTNVPGMFVALSVLHKGRWTHGDARTKNFVRDSEGVFPIDFERSRCFNGDDVANRAAVKGDIFRLAASILGLRGSSDLDQDVLSLIYSCSVAFYEDLSSAFDAYNAQSYSAEQAQKVAELVLRRQCAA